MIAMGISLTLVMCVALVSVIAIFASGNINITTDVLIRYNPELSVKVATNAWLKDDATKTEVLALVDSESASEGSVSKELTEDKNYVIFEFILQNTSAENARYGRLFYEDTTPDDNNIEMSYTTSTTELSIAEADATTFSPVNFVQGDITRVINNQELPPSSTGDSFTYVYVKVNVANNLKNANLNGVFEWELDIEEYTFDVKKDEATNTYYVEMGEYPQSYAGTTSTMTPTKLEGEQFGLISTSGTTSYDVYQDANGRYVLKSSKYYKFEPIIWDVLGYYEADGTTFHKYTETEFNNWMSSNLVIQSRTVLDSSKQWYGSNTDINFNESNMFNWLNGEGHSFLNDAFTADEQAKIATRTYKINDTDLIQVSNASACKEKELTDATTQLDCSSKVWLMSYAEIDGIYYTAGSNAARIAYNTAFAAGNETGGTATSYWLRSSFSYASYSYYYAGFIDTSGNLIYNYMFNTYGVRPALLVNL